MGRMRLWSIEVALLLAFTVLQGGDSWVAEPWRRIQQRYSTSLSLVTVTTPPDDSDVLAGVEEFNNWFRQINQASLSSCVQHAAFGSLRGLAYTGDDALLQGGGSLSILTLPATVVLNAPFRRDTNDWDSPLAQQLWRECQKGKQGALSGYIALLTRGEGVSTTGSLPAHTAPNALRHWTLEQRSVLETSPRGQALLQKQAAQELEWKNKFAVVSNDMTWEHFAWCMEVVHSRAFQGTYGRSTLRSVGSALAPILAAILGIQYMDGNPDVSNVVLAALAALAAMPTVVNMVIPDNGEVVLLPVIDSANHSEEADSVIEYDPWSQSFSLTIGPKCLAVNPEGPTQLYISYGKKTDVELLLNYGFLPGVSEDGDVNIQRQRLAEEFILRNTL
jgi:hypothetical protein